MAGGVESGGSDGLKRLPKGSQKCRIPMETRGKSSRSKKIVQIASKRVRNCIEKCLEGSPKVAKSTKSANNHQKAAKKQQNRHSGSFGSPIWMSWSFQNHQNHSFKRCKIMKNRPKRAAKRVENTRKTRVSPSRRTQNLQKVAKIIKNHQNLNKSSPVAARLEELPLLPPFR